MSKPSSLKRYAGLFNVLLIHDGGEYTPFINLLKGAFKSVNVQGLGECSIDKLEVHLLIVCGENKNFKLSEILEQLKKQSYFSSAFVSQNPSSLESCHFANSLKVSEVSSIPKNEDSFKKLIALLLPELRQKYSEDIANKRNAKIAQVNHCVFYTKTQATYISESLKKFLKVKDLEAYRAHEYHRMVMNTLKDFEYDTNEVLKFHDGSSALVRYDNLGKNEVLVSFNALSKELKSADAGILNRIDFIEMIKNLSLREEFKDDDVPLVVLSIQNSEGIVDAHNEITYNELVMNLVQMMSGLCAGVMKMGQWHKNILTILPNTNDLSLVAEQVKGMNEQAKIDAEVSGISLSLSTIVVNIKDIELNRVIVMMDHISTHSLDRKDLQGIEHIKISSSGEELNEKEKAFYYFEKAMLEKAEIKLSNFYKGLNISSFAQIIKIDNEKIYVIKDKMQGYAMKAEGKVLIQSPQFPMDILAKVKLVDISKKIAILSDFEILEFSANNRQYIRVQSDHRMHVLLTGAGNTFSATVLDLSIKAMACSLTNAKNIPEIGESMKLQFQLPSSRFEEGMAKLDIQAIITHIIEQKNEVKLVLDLNLEEPYESYLLEYIYERQQVLIKEVKQIAMRLS